MIKPYLIIFILFVSVSFMNTGVYAEVSVESSKPQGWHWYDAPAQEETEDEPLDPLEQMQIENENIKRALYTARKNPTKENVKQYIEMQNSVTREAKAFSKSWQEVLLENPQLNYAIKHPTNNTARMIEEDEMRKKEEATIHRLAKISGLFFFYKSTCAYCRAFAPTVKQFAAMYGITVIPITTDGVSLPEFPNSRIDQGQAELFGVKVEPALFIVNPYTHEKITLTYGLISLADLKSRIVELAAQHERDNQ
jgi:conjugal transfer pilus assembly protein TraF